MLLLHLSPKHKVSDEQTEFRKKLVKLDVMQLFQCRKVVISQLFQESWYNLFPKERPC